MDRQQELVLLSAIFTTIPSIQGRSRRVYLMTPAMQLPPTIPGTSRPTCQTDTNWYDKLGSYQLMEVIYQLMWSDRYAEG